jgi:cysteine desulfurase
VNASTELRRGRIYLDWNATTPPHPDVLAAMAEAARDAWGNPSSAHGHGRAARATVEAAREAIAGALGVHSRDVIFTSGATEANNLALRGAPALVTSRLEHPSVTRVAEALHDAGRPVHWVPVPEDGALDPDAVVAATEGLPEGFVVALMAANHETGVVQPVREVCRAVHERAGRVHVDAAQAFGKSPINWEAADSVAIAAHKVRGPKGVGVLVWGCGAPPRPVIVGGAQERGVRPGTVDPVGIAGMAAAVRRAAGEGPARHAALGMLRDHLEAALEERVLVNGTGVRLPHVSSLAVDGWWGDELVAALDLDGISVSSGSACSAGTPEPPAAVAAMVGRDRARRTLRVSLGEDTTAEDVEALVTALRRRLGASKG